MCHVAIGAFKRMFRKKNMYTVYEVDQELGIGEFPLSTCLEVGNRLPRKEKIANPRGTLGWGGGCMVASQIDPCITKHFEMRTTNFIRKDSLVIRFCAFTLV